ncbi:family A G protein-coupled receptor-like protein [Lepidopterella palustris CBS 459.81]|uniref:Family A G protein-coupled receptor-like protein n=1 Tax=Lepidopterella palustris CBS 459.81 TaxID=1314670 RepID=A0A8E2JIP8_9PEZI|nr:family A G protein-coupled receptor-like protein [Lepidopterella palustris CBS 459.81]
MFLEARAAPAPQYFPYPYSLDPLPKDIKNGLIPVGIFALLSVISTFILLAWITYRLVSWRQHYRAYVGYNQYVLLIYNLLLADLQQSVAFLISFHWIGQDKILAPTSACFAQAWLLHIGDVSSGFFVLAIAIHTWLAVVKGYKMPYKTFVAFILGIWAFAVILTLLGPAIHKSLFFTRAGAWCWISQMYESERLWLHYLWIFIDEFGTIIIYGSIFLHLRGQLKNIIHANHASSSNKLTQATRYMILYPAVYVVLTLPLAAGRMAAMTGTVLPDVYYCIAGSLLTSCGWLDAALYTLTRRVLVSNELTNTPRSRTRPDDPNGQGWEIHSFDKGTGIGDPHARTVTITGGSRTSNIATDRGRAAAITIPAERKFTHLRRGSSVSLEVSPVGSTDSIIKLPAGAFVGFGGVKAETKVEVRIEPLESDRESEGSSAKRVPGVRRHFLVAGL